MGILAGVVMMLGCARSSEAPAPSGSAPPGAADGGTGKVWSGSAPGTPAPAGSAFVSEIGETGPFPRIAPLPRGEGVRRMNARLDAIVRNMEPTRNVFLNEARAARLRMEVASIADLHEKISGTTFLADELLKTGRIDEAMRLIEPFVSPTPGLAPHVPPYARTHEFLGLAAMRLGETQNCITQHNGESCLLPIRGGGIYVAKEGPRQAIAHFKKSLELDPEDLGVRWLLNLAYMTLGEYPAGVPAQWLLRPLTFDSKGKMVRFKDVSGATGIDMRQHAGGSIFDDFDGDGLLDLVVSSMGVRDQLRYFRNRGDGRFEDRTEAAGLLGEWGGLNVMHADYNNDGWLDLLLLRGGWMGKGGRFPTSLLRNNGDGTFDDVTEEAGILTLRPTQTGSFADYDGDGWLDLMIGYESRADDAHRSELWHNERDGTFRNATVNLGNADFGYVKGVVFGDYDNDGRPDLYVSVQDGPNRLFHNGGPRTPPGPAGEDWRFTDVTEKAGVVAPRFSFPTWFFDFDNDGWLDLMAAAFHFVDLNDAVATMVGLPHRMEPPSLYRNNHDGTFTDVARTAGLDRMALPMGSNYADFDGDGWLDIYVGTGEPNLRSLVPNQMFRNVEGKRYEDVSVAAGVANIQKGHGIAPADVDNDGDLDFFSEMGGWYEADIAHSNLFLNPGNGHAWVTLRLEGRRSNRSAIGTRLRVRVRTAAGTRDIHRVVESGGSFGGGSLQQEVGLGRATAIERIEVTWPTTGETQRFENVGMRRVWRIVEGDAALVPVNLPAIRFDQD